MATESTPVFPGFPDFQANVTFTPRQFFTVVVPHPPRGVVRIVGFVLRKILGWVDRNGNPTQTRVRLTYREIVEQAGVSREEIPKALAHAVDNNFIKCVQAPKPDTQGNPARPGIYEICWDREGEYTDNPALFRGFIYREAIVIPEGRPGKPVLRATAARKNIPNAYFDQVLPNEKLSVIRLVGALLYYSIQWGPAGERKMPVSRSISALSRLTRQTRQRTHAAVLEAQRQGYIDTTDSGFFDTAAGRNSRAATYTIRWVRTPQPRSSAPPGTGEHGVQASFDRSEKVNGLPIRKSARDRPKKVNGERSEKVNDITVKTDNSKTLNTTAPVPTGAASKENAAAVESVGFNLLSEAGFDTQTARQLAQRHTAEVIQRQIAWLALRSPTKSRLGLLRRAIEQDWAKPETGHPESPTRQQARSFASHYYAAYHDFKGKAATEPLSKDMDSAEKFIPRLLGIHADPTRLAEWGRRFGHLVRNQHKNSARAIPNLSVSIPIYGDGFLRILEKEVSARDQVSLGKAREAHHRAFTPAYLSYLGQREIGLLEANPCLYEAFALNRAQFRETTTTGIMKVPKSWLERFDSEESRLLAFAEYFAHHPEHRIPDFWEWDSTVNPQRFGTGISGEAHS